MTDHSAYVICGDPHTMLYRAVCGCGWQSEKFQNHTLVQNEAIAHECRAAIEKVERLRGCIDRTIDVVRPMAQDIDITPIMRALGVLADV